MEINSTAQGVVYRALSTVHGASGALGRRPPERGREISHLHRHLQRDLGVLLVHNGSEELLQRLVGVFSDVDDGVGGGGRAGASVGVFFIRHY